MILLDTSVLVEMFRMKDKSATYFYQLSKEHDNFLNLKHFKIIPDLHILNKQ